MPAKKLLSWKEAFLKPSDISTELFECPDEMYFKKQCYPAILDSVPAVDRHKEGYFFADEVTRKNADQVRFVRVRTFDPVKPMPWDMDEGMEKLSLKKLFSMRAADGEMQPYILPDYPLENLKVVIGGVMVPENSYPLHCQAERISGDVLVYGKGWFEKLMVARGRVTVFQDGDGRFPFLEACGPIRVLENGYANFVSISANDSIEIVGGQALFPLLKRAGTLSFTGKKDTRENSLGCPVLNRVDKLNIHMESNPTSVSLPKLSSVYSHLSCSGNLHLDFPSLVVTGGMSLNGTGYVNLPMLDEVGAFYVRSSSHFGSCELVASGGPLKVDAPALTVVHGDLEYCNGVGTKLSSLESVYGNLYANCGHWIYLKAGEGYTRKKVDDVSMNVIQMDSLGHVGKNLSVFDNCRLVCPNLKSVDWRLDMYSNASVKSKGRFEVGALGKLVSVDASFKLKKNFNPKL